jgi:hypothetical protein
LKLLRRFLQRHFTSTLLGLAVPPAPSSQTLTVHVFPLMSDTKFHTPHETSS